MNLNSHTIFICKLSLSFMWLFIAATSFWWAREEGYIILAHGHIEHGFADVFINLGSFLDAAIGLWLLTNLQLIRCYQLQIVVIVSYTILLSLIDASFWLHPFGPIIKNVPIIALLIVLLDAHQKPIAT